MRKLRLIKQLFILAVALAVVSIIFWFGMFHTAHAADMVSNEIIVKFKKDVTPEDKDIIKKLYNLKEKNKDEQIGSETLVITDGKDPKDVATQISHDPAVEFAEPNYIAPLPGTK